MSQYQRSPGQVWHQPLFVPAAQAAPAQEENNDPGRQLAFSTAQSAGLHQAPQSHEQLQNHRSRGYYHSQPYPSYAQQQQHHHPRPQPQPQQSRDMFQPSFISGHVDPQGFTAGTGQQITHSFGGSPSNVQVIDTSFGLANIQSSSPYVATDFNQFGNGQTGVFDLGGQSTSASSELNPDEYYNMNMSPDSIPGYSSPPQPPPLQPFKFQDVPAQSSSDLSSPPGKRPRTEVDAAEEEVDGEEGKGKLAQKPKACQRCKGLKVKCEPSKIPGTCKKCTNGGHECLQPGETKRRRPPKREDLLNKIREQADIIERLIGQLKEANMNQDTGSDISRPNPNGASSGDAPRFDRSALSSTNDYFADVRSNPHGLSPSKDVLDWIEKARQSLAEFGGYINIAGANTPRSFVAEADPEDPDSSDDPDEFFGTPRDTDDDERIAIELEGPEGRKVETDKELRGRLSDSSIGTAGLSGLSIKGKKADKLTNIPNESSPFGLMAELARKKIKGRDSSNERSVGEPEVEVDEEGAGIANVNFFNSAPGSNPLENKHGLMSKEQQPPHILTSNIVTPEEVEKLFTIFFTYMNLSVSLLDPNLYTAKKTCWRSPFLFTVICAIASRHYVERPDLHKQVMHCAQLAAGSELISGHKSVETVSAYILLALYPVPVQRWEDDRSWIYLGLAIRIATDLNLHHPNTAKPVNEQHAREMLNRTRIWLNCFNLDRSMSSQYGKSPTIRNTDYVATHSEEWYESSIYNLENFDIHLATYNAELRLVYDFVGKIYSDPKHPTGLNKDVDFEELATETDNALVLLKEKWFFKLCKTTNQNDPQNVFRTNLLKLAFSYARLVSLSYGFQHSFGKNDIDENPFLQRCLSAATDVVNCVVDDIGQSDVQRKYLRHGPEAQSVFVTFACAFLVKLLQPKFASYLSQDQRVMIRKQVERVISLLSSTDVAIDNLHGPKLYSRFLKGLLATPMARIDLSSDGSGLSRKNRKKSPSADESRAFEGNAIGSHHASPTSSHSLSPPPESTLAIPFDQFAPVTGGIDPLLPLSNMARAFVAPMEGANDIQLMEGTNMLTNDFFRPPLPFDDDILQSMQVLSEPGWGDASLPAFSWMQSFQNGGDSYMTGGDESTNYEQFMGYQQQM